MEQSSLANSNVSHKYGRDIFDKIKNLSEQEKIKLQESLLPESDQLGENYDTITTILSLLQQEQKVNASKKQEMAETQPKSAPQAPQKHEHDGDICNNWDKRKYSYLLGYISEPQRFILIAEAYSQSLHFPKNNFYLIAYLNIFKKNSEILEEKLAKLFRAIFEKDLGLKEITKDAFEWMKKQKIKGNICPHIKKAIQECLKEKKKALNELWIAELICRESENSTER